MQNIALAALLIIEHKRDRDTRAIGPMRVGWLVAVADQITRVGGAQGESFERWFCGVIVDRSWWLRISQALEGGVYVAC